MSDAPLIPDPPRSRGRGLAILLIVVAILGGLLLLPGVCTVTVEALSGRNLSTPLILLILLILGGGFMLLNKSYSPLMGVGGAILLLLVPGIFTAAWVASLDVASLYHGWIGALCAGTFLIAYAGGVWLLIRAFR